MLSAMTLTQMRVLAATTASIAVLLAVAGAGGCKKGAGPERDCKTMECVRAVYCVPASCNGEPVTSGCCPCPAGLVDMAECPKDGGPASDAKPD